MFSFNYLKRLLIRQSLLTSAYAAQQLSNTTGLAVLSSDAISSVAHATQEILLVLITAGSTALAQYPPIAFAIVLPFLIVVIFDQQIIRAYANSGGAHTVSKENLGTYFNLVGSLTPGIQMFYQS